MDETLVATPIDETSVSNKFDTNGLTLTAAEIEEKIQQQQKSIEKFVAEANKQIASMNGALAVWQHLLARAQKREVENGNESGH